MHLKILWLILLPAKTLLCTIWVMLLWQAYYGGHNVGHAALMGILVQPIWHMTGWWCQWLMAAMDGTTAKLSYYNKKNINTIYSMYHLLQPWSNAQMVIISGSQNKNNPPWSQNIIKVINKSLDTYGSTGYHHGWQTQLSNQLYASHTYEAPMPASYSLHEKPRLWLKVL